MSGYGTSGPLALPHACVSLEFALESPNTQFHYRPAFREYSIRDRAVEAEMFIDFCPFCGVRFPPSLRDLFMDRFFDEFPDADLADLPPTGDLRDGDAWWRNDPELTCDVVEIPVMAERRVVRPCSRAEADLVALACRLDSGDALPGLFVAGRPVWFYPAQRRIVSEEVSDDAPGRDFIQLESVDESRVAFIDVCDGRAFGLSWGESASSVWVDLEHRGPSTWRRVD